MTDQTEAVQALRDAARGWRELCAHVDEVVQTLSQEVGGVLAADWRGSGAEGFAAQWALLRGAVQEALPAFELAASDLEQAADAAEAALGGDAGADSGLGAGELAGNDVSPTSGTESHSAADTPTATSSGDSMSALDSLVSAQLSEGFSHGSQTLDGGVASETTSGEPNSQGAKGSTGGTGDSVGSALPPPAMRTESVVSSLGKLAATIATVFDRSGRGGAGAGAGIGSLPLPSTPYDSSFLRHSDGMLGESLGADPVEAGQGPGDKPQDDAARDDKGTPDTEGSPIDNDDLPAPDETPDNPGTPERDRDEDPEGVDPEGVDPDPTTGNPTPRGAFG